MVAEVTPLRLPPPEPNPNPRGLDPAYITLEGKDYPVTKLAIRQNRIVVPLCYNLIRELGPMMVLVEHHRVTNEPWTEAEINQLALTTAQIDQLIDLNLACIWREHPNFSKDQFLDMQISTRDLMAGFAVALKQSDLFKPVKPGEPRSGEAKAGSLTGT